VVSGRSHPTASRICQSTARPLGQATVVATTISPNASCDVAMADEKSNTEALAKPTSDDGGELGPPPSNYILKLDLRLIPLLGCTYTILFLDRTNSE
jgi:hypothetical protein